MATKYQVLTQERHELRAEGAGILDKAERTADEEARLVAITEQVSALNAQIEAEERAREALRGAPAERIYGMHDLATDRPWASFGEFLQKVAEAGSPGARVDARLYQAGPSGASVGVPSDGGFLVRKDYSTALLEAGFEASQLAPLCDQIPIGEGSDGLEAPYIDETNRANGSRFGGVRVYRRGEAETVTATQPKLALFDLRLEDMMGLMYTTERLLRDATALEAIATRSFASEFGFKLDDEIANGTGAGECLGYMKSPALVTVAKETGQGAATIMVENISKMWARIPARKRGAVTWLYNQDVEPQLDALALQVGVAALEPRFVTYGPDGVLRIKGRPAMALEQCETLGTTGDIVAVNLQEYALITKGGIEAAQSIHVRFVYNERTFRWVYPVNGAPKWKAPKTPFKGTANTQSPFVALATRA